MAKDCKFSDRLITEIVQGIGIGMNKIRIDNSQYRQSWFDFKQQQLEMYVQEQLGCME